MRDRNYATPLKVAKKAGVTAAVELMLSLGAKVGSTQGSAARGAGLGTWSGDCGSARETWA